MVKIENKNSLAHVIDGGRSAFVAPLSDGLLTMRIWQRSKNQQFPRL